MTTRRTFLVSAVAALAAPAIVRATPRAARWFVKTPGSTSAAAAWGLENSQGASVDISNSRTSGLQEFLNLCASSGCAGMADGGQIPSVSVATLAFLQDPVDVPPMYLGAIEMRGVNLICAHSGPYVLRVDSIMSSSLLFDGGEIVMNSGAPGQIGVLIQPRVPVPIDGSIVAGMVHMRFSSIVGAQDGQWGSGQVLCLVDGSFAPCQGLKIELIEPNGGDYGLAAIYGAHGYQGLELDIVGAHKQFYSCVDLGHGAAAPCGTKLSLTAFSGPHSFASQYVDTWETGGIYDVIAEEDGGAPARAITFEQPSKNCRVRLGGSAVAPIICAPGAGPNHVNETTY